VTWKLFSVWSSGFCAAIAFACGYQAMWGAAAYSLAVAALCYWASTVHEK
jgi:hypothetical protein